MCAETLKMLSAVQGLDDENCFHIINDRKLHLDNLEWLVGENGCPQRLTIRR